MKKGVIIDLKNQYTYILCKNAKIKRIKREYYHEIGKEIEVPFLSQNKIIPAVILSCFMIIAFTLNPFVSPQVNALSYVTLKVNPGLVFKVDNNKVVGVSYTNKDGNNMTQKIDFINHTLEDSVILFIDYCFENNYFTNDNNIDINVISDDASQIKNIEDEINRIINEYLKTHQTTITLSLDKVSENQHQNAQELGIPDSKLKLIDMILYYYPDLNQKELSKESVDDLIDILEDIGYDEDALDHLEDKLEQDEKDNDDDEDDDDEDDD